jgi:hypothetical protein
MNMQKQHFLGCIGLLLAAIYVLAIGCSKADASVNASGNNGSETNALKDATQKNPGYLSNILMDKITYDSVLYELAHSTEAQALINNEVTVKAKQAKTETPTPVQSVKTSSAAQATASTDGSRTLALALQWFFFQKASDAKTYLDKAKDFLMAWAAVNVASDHTPAETSMLDFYKAYSIIRSQIDASSRSTIDHWFVQKYNYFKTLSQRNNNWETIKNLYLLHIAFMLNDAARITEAKNSFTRHHDKEFRLDGASVDFLARDAFAYQAYDLQFVGQALRTLYIYEGRNVVNGWVNHRSANWVIPVRTPSQEQAVNPEFFQPASYSGGPVTGGSLADAIAFMKPYMLDTVHYKHLEFYYTEWTGDFTRSDYKKQLNPNSIVYALHEVMAVMRDEIRAIMTAMNPGYSRYKNGLAHYLNSFGVPGTKQGPPMAILAGEVGYLGWTKQLPAGSYTLANLQSIGVSTDQLSSITVPAGCKITLYDGGNFDGSSLVLQKNAIDLGKFNFNDKMSSLKVERM